MRGIAGRLSRVVCTVAALLLAGSFLNSALAQQRIGSATSISNQVEISRGAASSPLSVGGDVHLNELVRTGDNSLARLAFLDATNLSLGPRAQVRLDRFVYNPASTAGSVVVRATQGAMRFVTGAQRPQNYLIQTPIASIAVRGTVFDLYVQGDRIVVTLISGTIIVTPIGAAAIVVSTPGESLTVYAGGRSVRRAEWQGTAQPDFAALFGATQLAGLPTPFSGRFPMSFGVTIGGAFIHELPTGSTLGFYKDGNIVGIPTSFMFGVQAFGDLATFNRFAISAGLMADFMAGSAFDFSGLCGAIDCRGHGRLNEANVLGALKFTTAVTPTDSVNFYVGAGFATLFPTGRPTGLGGPEFRGNASAGALRLGIGIDRRLSEFLALGFTTGVQFTGATKFDTTLVGESFRISEKTEVTFGVTFTFFP
jgi:hypothetical protein